MQGTLFSNLSDPYWGLPWKLGWLHDLDVHPYFYGVLCLKLFENVSRTSNNGWVLSNIYQMALEKYECL